MPPQRILATVFGDALVFLNATTNILGGGEGD